MSVRRSIARAALVAAVAVGAAVMAGGGAVARASQGGQSGPPQGVPPGPPPGRGGGGPGGIEQMLPQLELTTAQLEQVRTLLASQRDAESQYQDELGQYANQMKSLVEASAFDEDAVRALAVKEAAATVEMRLIHARTGSAIYQLLTADQKKLLATLVPKAPPRGKPTKRADRPSE